MRIVVLLLATIFSLSLSAQVKELTGSVCDINFMPISNATIIISHNDSVIGITESNGDGKFKISGLPLNMKVGIYIHQLNYQSISDSVDLKETDNYFATMHSRSFELDSITVLGNRGPIRTPYGHIYFLSKEAVESGNPFKALQEIPKLQSDYINESLSSVDGKSILLLVDGSKFNSGLKTIDPSRIASVEVIDVVSSKYLRTGAGRIVNVHLKPSKTIYTYLMLGFGNTFPWKQGWTGPTLEVGNSKLSLYIDLTPSWNRYNHSRSNVSTTSTDYNRDTHEDANSRSHDMDYTIMLKWHPTKRDYYIFSFQGYDRQERSYSHAVGTHKDLGSMSMFDYSSAEANEVKSHVYTQTLYYKHDFNNSLSLDGDVRYAYNHNGQESYERQTMSNYIVDSRQDFTTNRRSWNQELNLSWDINDHFSLDFGNETDYSANKVYKMNNSSNYEFKGLNEYGYISLSMIFSELSTVVSSGIDYMRLNSAGTKHNYTRPNASVNLSFEKGVSTTSLSYTLSNTQPSISRLNPFNTSTDSLQYVSGNPMLVPERTHTLTFEENIYHKGLNINTELNYEYMKDMILPYSYYNNGVHYSTYSNYGHYHYFSIAGSVSYSFKGFNIGTTAKYGVIDYEERKARKNFSLDAFAMWNFRKLGVHTSLSYMNKSYSLYSETHYHRPYSSNLAISYNLNPNLIFILGWRCIYGKAKNSTYYHINDYSSSTTFKNTDSQLFFTVRWTIRKNKKNKIDIDEDRIKKHERGITL